jgi:hypothetical protein
LRFVVHVGQLVVGQVNASFALGVGFQFNTIPPSLEPISNPTPNHGSLLLTGNRPHPLIQKEKGR